MGVAGIAERRNNRDGLLSQEGLVGQARSSVTA
jgi:hypothetical protein